MILHVFFIFVLYESKPPPPCLNWCSKPMRLCAADIGDEALPLSAADHSGGPLLAKVTGEV